MTRDVLEHHPGCTSRVHQLLRGRDSSTHFVRRRRHSRRPLYLPCRHGNLAVWQLRGKADGTPAWMVTRNGHVGLSLFVTRLMDRSLGGVMPRGMNGLDGSLLMQDDKNSGQELRRGGPRPKSGKDTRCTPAYRMFTANRCCPWVWEGMELSPASRLPSWKGHVPPVRYLDILYRKDCLPV